MRRKRHLEMLLERIPPHPHPDPGLEQYLTPAHVAAEVLWAARAMGDIEGRTVADLGCGTGILGIGAALLGAERVYCVDVDAAALEVAEDVAEDLGLGNIQFIKADIRDHGDLVKVTGRVDTVVQNPPLVHRKGLIGVPTGFSWRRHRSWGGLCTHSTWQALRTL